MYSQDTNQGFQATHPDDRPDRREHGQPVLLHLYNTEEDWDYVFVEAHTVGQDDWTTLPDANGAHGPEHG